MMTSAGWTDIVCSPEAIMFPQLAPGGGTPSDRKLSAPS